MDWIYIITFHTFSKNKQKEIYLSFACYQNEKIKKKSKSQFTIWIRFYWILKLILPFVFFFEVCRWNCDFYLVFCVHNPRHNLFFYCLLVCFREVLLSVHGGMCCYFVEVMHTTALTRFIIKRFRYRAVLFAIFHSLTTQQTSIFMSNVVEEIDLLKLLSENHLSKTQTCMFTLKEAFQIYIISQKANAISMGLLTDQSYVSFFSDFRFDDFTIWFFWEFFSAIYIFSHICFFQGWMIFHYALQPFCFHFLKHQCYTEKVNWALRINKHIRFGFRFVVKSLLFVAKTLFLYVSVEKWAFFYCISFRSGCMYVQCVSYKFFLWLD